MAIRLNSLTPAQVREVIELARRKAANSDPVQNASPGMPSVSNAEPPELQQLVTVIDQLPSPAKNELMTLAWLGMGTIDPDHSSWAELLQATQEEQINDVPERLALMPRLHEYLHRGLEKVV